MISVVFPAYNEEGNVEELHRQIKQVLLGMHEPFEIIAVENGSNDRTLERLKKLSPITIIVFPRNYGQTGALDAGIQAAAGDYVVIMDADLQNDPDDIPLMIQKLKVGYDCIVGWRKNREDSWGRRLLSKAANWFTSFVSGVSLHDHACGIKAFKRQFIQGVHLYGEMHVFLGAILHGRGARVTEMEVRHHPRRAGLSKHYFFKAVKDIADLFTIKFMATYSSRPMVFFGGFGVLALLVSAAAFIAMLVMRFAGYAKFGQTPLPLVTTLLGLTGLILIMIGFLAELIIRTYYEAKNKTPYFIKEIIENR